MGKNEHSDKPAATEKKRITDVNAPKGLSSLWSNFISAVVDDIRTSPALSALLGQPMKAPARKQSKGRKAAEVKGGDKKGTSPSRSVVSKKAEVKPGQEQMTPLERRKKIGVPEESIKVIRSQAEMPEYYACLTVQEAELPLSKEEQSHFVLLQPKEKEQKLLLLIDSNLMGETSLMTRKGMALVQRARGKGYSVSRVYANPSVIEIIYDNERSKGLLADPKVTSKLQKEYDELLLTASSLGVSDIHIEVRRDKAYIRFRRDGQLSQYDDMAVSKARRFAAVIYMVVAESDSKEVSFNESVSQDAVVDRVVEGKRIRVRLATNPAYPDGFDVVMRILPMAEAGFSLKIEDLGYHPKQVDDIERASARPKGVLVFAGTTGSGKSTSLSALLTAEIKEKRGTIKVITVEDPPENVIPGATQRPIVRRGKDDENPFADAMRAALRNDPDVIMIGEIRDEESAALSVKAAQSGHKVLTTLHAPSATGIATRLRVIGVPNDVLGSKEFLAGMIYQTLVPITCKHCSHTVEKFEGVAESKHERETLARVKAYFTPEERADVRFRSRDGCEHCNKGVTGRKVVAEIIVPDDRFRQLIAEGKDYEAEEHYNQNCGGRLVHQFGLDLVENGECCPFEFEERLDRIGEQERVPLSHIERVAPSPESESPIESVPAEDEAAVDPKVHVLHAPQSLEADGDDVADFLAEDDGEYESTLFTEEPGVVDLRVEDDSDGKD
ncbi:GspE/PulE family protein [Ferrimonas marina]|uniref:Type II secretory pathway ATPase GspE/PulE or T4P pilus assembly pathway ATPase PilB n=1 Tax=Ferrimonas marina TaxID=299255 RepID=A0A1M5TJD5_9GAMM|nr:ATPase, T2SS/T4P/T4SS family [Ferrimonas marina]SHH50791.1 Type II secretory pathway ATPase GspE/PulE or T4P pilus assembly pathway ATPase PilB [Ferrimonas marina]